MNTPLSWIKAYVPGLECTDQEYNDRITLTGTKVDGVKKLDKNLEKIVVGRIEKIERHPDAERLVVCQVNVGEANGGVIQIVTGASNVAEKDVIPVVLDGGRVAGGHDGSPNPEEGIRIRAGKLRGIISNGMMCGIEELGSDREAYPDAPENGVYVFNRDAEPEIGTDAVEALGLRDTVFEYEITSNRVDCYSVLGIAREAAATFDLPFVPPVVTVEETEEKTADHISVEIEDPDLCSRYCARICTDVVIAPSPEWMQRRLANAGIRPINNLVDITNYVMLEYGQPMHAFDLDEIRGGKIIVRRAKDGDVFETLDEQERKLDRDVLMICDEERQIAIAGIMGGQNSKITENVHTVLFESATFNGPNIRKSAKRIGLRTDASGLFEKGLDPVNAEAAINRACQLMQELGGGKVMKGMVDVKNPIRPLTRIPFRAEQINAFLGTDYSEETMMEIFRKLELGYDEQTGELIIPSFRQDLLAMCDISEEVARFTGYDNIPMTLPESGATVGGITPKLVLEEHARKIAEHYGFNEAMNYSFESPKVMEKLLFGTEAPERQGIRIMNPLGEDFSVMRTTPLNGMLTSLATNYNRRNRDVRLYEIATVYLADSLPLTELPDERTMFTLGMYGEGDFFAMKGIAEEFLRTAGLTEELEYQAVSVRNFLHPGRQADICYKGKIIGYLGEVHPDIMKNYGLGERTYIGVIDLKTVLPEVNFEPHFRGIVKFPAVSRDLSMLVPGTVMAGDIEKVIRKHGGSLLESYRLFDIYEGKQVQEGFKSLAYNLTFRNRERTLEEQEISSAMDKVLKALGELGIQLRS